MLRCEVQLPTRATGLVVRPRRRGQSASTATRGLFNPEEAYHQHHDLEYRLTETPRREGHGPVVDQALDIDDIELIDEAGAEDVRDADNLDDLEALVFFPDRLHLLEASSGLAPMRLGPPLRLTDAATGLPHAVCDSTPCPVYEPATDSVVFVEGYALMRLGAVAGLPEAGRNGVEVLAGNQVECDQEDGVGPDARFLFVRGLAADGRGNVYVAESTCVRKLSLVLPEEGRAAETEGRHEAADQEEAALEGRNADSGYGPETAEREEVEHEEGVGMPAAGGPFRRVTTLPGSEPPRDRWTAIAYDPASDTLFAATDTAVFRIPLRASISSGGGGARGSGGSGGGSGGVSRPHMPVLLAGDPHLRGRQDGRGSDARFYSITAMLAAPLGAGAGAGGGGGGVYLVDGSLLRELTPRGDVRTLTARGGALPDDCSCMAVLPQGCLAVAGSPFAPHELVALGAGLRCRPQATGTGGSRGPRTAGGCALSVGGKPLPPPLSAGLLRQPSDGGAATVTLRVGGTALVAHRAVLRSRSEYFAHLLSSGFAEHGAAVLQLPEADPDAFGALLAYMYTGQLRRLPRALLRPAAELAGRLLMPAAASELQRRLLAAATPATVVADLLWAERHSLTELAAGLKRYFVRRPRQVAEAAPAAVRALAEGSPGLAGELLLELSMRGRAAWAGGEGRDGSFACGGVGHC
ncbi:hypothetical protein GPECTOR_5g47 [Gonium pectorale]|uniref:BTB domain-containing protein n=1 Tax=Gonium pectorale TaxID=33097 RepID=A0A150GYJ5_GONPE|nr:hypothetical protein GPECTOR_5g47 [Gonium pectorale]|eukprot:KXZ54390.1 hypothetical protein GPECTOR_5g47 [Gonium pectorale]